MAAKAPAKKRAAKKTPAKKAAAKKQSARMQVTPILKQKTARKATPSRGPGGVGY